MPLFQPNNNNTQSPQEIAGLTVATGVAMGVTAALVELTRPPTEAEIREAQRKEAEKRQEQEQKEKAEQQTRRDEQKALEDARKEYQKVNLTDLEKGVNSTTSDALSRLNEALIKSGGDLDAPSLEIAGKVNRANEMFNRLVAGGVLEAGLNGNPEITLNNERGNLSYDERSGRLFADITIRWNEGPETRFDNFPMKIADAFAEMLKGQEKRQAA